MWYYISIMLAKDKLEKLLRILILAGLLALVIIIFSQQTEFTAVDLGRHLENGKIVWQNPQVLWQNFYSYTEPNFRFVNHHWLSGVLFYFVYLIGGFKLLSILNVLVALTAFLLAFNLAKKRAGFYLSALMALPVIFLLSERVEIRPEMFSYLLIIITWVMLEKTAGDRNWKRLYWFIPLFIVWANLHIYFFIGLALVGFKLLAEFSPLFIKTSGPLKSRLLTVWPSVKPWAISLGASFLVCLINPNTWRGLLYPFNIFQNYGYEIAENKTIFYLGHLSLNPNFPLFKTLLFLLVLSWIAYFVFVKKLRLFELLASLFFSLLALFASRNLALFALVALIIIPVNLTPPWQYLKSNLAFWRPEIREKLKPYLLALFALIIISGLFYLSADSRRNNNFLKNPLGFGLTPGSADSVKFFKDNNLSGPILNNYDLGSALIFWLFPNEKVFVDNRPEAYSQPFFADTYRPLQTNSQKWAEINERYKFKAIYFSHTDGTPWAQQFLGRILNDADWALVYFDRYTVILLNKKLNDEATVKKLSLDSWAFRSRLRSLAAESGLRSKFNLASLAEKARQPDLAEEIYREVLVKYPNYNQALISLGALYAASGDRGQSLESLKYLQAALDNGYKLPGLYNQIGLVNWQLGEYQKAETAWRSALKLERKNISALYYLSQIDELRRAGEIPFVWPKQK